MTLQNATMKPASPQKGENHLLNSMAHQMEENSRVHETAAKDRERMEKAEEALAAMAAERASKIVRSPPPCYRRHSPDLTPPAGGRSSTTTSSRRRMRSR